MPTITSYVALPFKLSEDEHSIIAGEPNEVRSAEQAVRMAALMAAMERHCGAIAFSRTGDPALHEFADADVLRTFGEVDTKLLHR